MKVKLYHKLTAAVCALALLLALVPPAQAAGNPVKSTNINKQDYTTYGNTVTSYLYVNASGGLTRVEYTGGAVVVEDYNSSYELVNSRSITPELPVWGGFFAGADANYLIFGQNNTSESASTEVIRVVKYSKDWVKQGSTSVKGAYVETPFAAGSVRCAEYGGYLYIHAARRMTKQFMTMYGPMSDGSNHQANLTLEIRESDMQLVDSYDQVWNLDFGYVSHSFNQFILIDQNQNIVTLDHSDSNSDAGGRSNYGYAKPVTSRGVDLIRYDEKAGQDHFQGKGANQRFQWCDFSLVQAFGGTSGNNVTGASIGGFAETTGGYVSAYNYDGQGSSASTARDVYLGYTTKDGLKSSAKKISASAGTTTPQLASTGLGGGWVLWNGKTGSAANDTLYYASYSDGGTAGAVKTASAPLSDCQPVYYNGMAVWYVTNNSAPTFYGLNESGVTVLKSLSAPAAPETPAEPEKPVEPEKPAEPETPTEPERPAEPEKPVTPEKPAEPEKPTTPPSTENNPAYAVPSNGRYLSGSFGWNDANGVKEQIDFSVCCPRSDIATVNVYDASGAKVSTPKPSFTNVAYGSSVQKVQAGSSPNYKDSVTLLLCTATFPAQYTVNIQVGSETTTLKKGDTLSGPVNGYNTVALKWDTGRGDIYYFFYLESEDQTPASVRPQQPSATTPDTTKPDTTKPDTTKPDTTKPDTTKPSTTTPGTTKPDTTTPSTTKPSTTPGTAKNPFTDVPANAYYTDAVLWALENGVTTGATATTFEPNSTCTRAQVATFLWRAKGCPEPGIKTNPFRDVKTSDYFYKAVLWAYEQGITTGDTATTFDPEGTCTNGHVVTFLWRAENKPAASGSSSLAQPGYFYTDAVAWADTTGLLKDTGTAFDPDARSPRANIVTYLYRDLAE